MQQQINNSDGRIVIMTLSELGIKSESCSITIREIKTTDGAKKNRQ